MSNTIKLRADGIIETSFDGPQPEMVISPIIEATIALQKQLRAEGKPVLMLADYTGMGGIDAHTRKYILKQVKQYDYDKVAAFGNNPKIKYMSQLLAIALALLRSDKSVKIFDTKEEAESWLLPAKVVANTTTYER